MKLGLPSVQLQRMPALVQKNAFLRQTWALLQRNAVLHGPPEIPLCQGAERASKTVC